MSLLGRRDAAAIEKQLDPAWRAQIDQLMPQMFAAYPAGDPIEARAFNYTVKTDTQNGTIYALDILYRFPAGKDMVAQVVLANAGKSYIVKGIHMQVFPDVNLARNEFSLQRAPASGYLFLGGMIGAVAVSLWALVACIRSRGIRRKWLWIIFIVFGLGKLTLNWASGEFFLQPLAVVLLSAGALRSGFGPWTMMVGLPIGATIFLLRRKSLVRNVQERKTEGKPPEPSPAPDATREK
ncbi:MAG: hypothetical protein JO208_00585 [Alphaproteobacteria bacterium]|nr:hypothetical protein [Alphaproteobacteria bacterium]